MLSRLACAAGLVVGGWVAALAPPALGDEPLVFAKGGVAIAGYDVVVYFRESRAARGSMDHALMWRGATWLFVSDQTMEAFEMNPQSYAPQYGGYCAYAAAQGKMLPSDPEVFTIRDGKLYLNGTPMQRDMWLADPSGNISAANEHWAIVMSR